MAQVTIIQRLTPGGSTIICRGATERAVTVCSFIHSVVVNRCLYSGLIVRSIDHSIVSCSSKLFLKGLAHVQCAMKFDRVVVHAKPCNNKNKLSLCLRRLMESPCFALWSQRRPSAFEWSDSMGGFCCSLAADTLGGRTVVEGRRRRQ